MGCGVCGKFDLGDKLGKCAYCIRLAAVSSIVFWGLFYLCYAVLDIRLLAAFFLFFAAMVTLLLVAHVLAFLSSRTRG
ncbi:MAG: DUF3624 family protein [Burkholderiales bacterium]